MVVFIQIQIHGIWIPVSQQYILHYNTVYSTIINLINIINIHIISSQESNFLLQILTNCNLLYLHIQYCIIPTCHTLSSISFSNPYHLKWWMSRAFTCLYMWNDITVEMCIQIILYNNNKWNENKFVLKTAWSFY